MKKLLSICIFTLLTTLLTAQVSKTINVPTAGTLTNLLTASEKTTVTNLTVSGNINDLDVKCMRDEITLLEELDISNVIIYGNTMPAFSFSFYNNFTPKDNLTLNKIKLPNNIISIGQSAFAGCINLSDILIPITVTVISDHAFEYCSKITNLIIPNSVTSIGYRTFFCWYSLNSLTLGEEVNSIGYEAFGGSYCNIKTIYSKNPKPPTLASYSFGNYSSVTSVIVPSVAVTTYKAAPGWNDYFSSVIIADISSYISAPQQINNQVKVYSTNSEIIVEGTSKGETVIIYKANGKQIQTFISRGEKLNIPVANEAVYLVKTPQKTFKVIL